MTATILGGLGILISGKLIDYFGIRKSLLLALPLWVLTLLSFGSYSSMFKVVQNFLSREVFCIVFLTGCISMLRLLGQNVLPLLGRMQIVRTFSSREGFTIAIYGTFVASTRGIIPLLMKLLSRNDDWEHAFRVLSFTGLILLLLVFFFFHDRSEVNPIPCQPKKNKCIQIPFASKRQILRTPVFWCIASALCLNEFIGTGTAIHIVDIFRERGISENIALGTYIPLSIFSVISGFPFGKLVDLGKIKLTILLMFLTQFLGLVGLNFAQNWGCTMLYAAAIGSAWGAHRVLLIVSWSKIFGQERIGEILGIVYFLSTITGAVSVPLMSLLKHQFGTYFVLIHILQLIIISCAIFCIKKFPKFGQ
jgi:MFS family permease